MTIIYIVGEGLAPPDFLFLEPYPEFVAVWSNHKNYSIFNMDVRKFVFGWGICDISIVKIGSPPSFVKFGIIVSKIVFVTIVINISDLPIG